MVGVRRGMPSSSPSCTVAALSFVLGLLFLANTPLSKLTDVMKKVEQQIQPKVVLQGKDEAGKLAQNLNAMIEKLNAAKKEAEQYHQALVQRGPEWLRFGRLGNRPRDQTPPAGMGSHFKNLAEGFPK